MVYIPKKEKLEYEKVLIDEWINGEIVDVQEFKDVEQQYTNDEGEVDVRRVTKVRFKFNLEEYVYGHYSKKMTASMNEKSNLFKFLRQIYGDRLLPDIAVDLDKLKGLKVKTMWDEVTLPNDNIFQWTDKIRPLENNLPAIWDVEEAKEDTSFK